MTPQYSRISADQEGADQGRKNNIVVYEMREHNIIIIRLYACVKWKQEENIINVTIYRYLAAKSYKCK